MNKTIAGISLVVLCFFSSACSFNIISGESNINTKNGENLAGILFVPNRPSIKLLKAFSERGPFLFMLRNAESDHSNVSSIRNRAASLSGIDEIRIANKFINGPFVYEKIKNKITESPSESHYMSYTVYIFGDNGSQYTKLISDGAFTEWLIQHY